MKVAQKLAALKNAPVTAAALKRLVDAGLGECDIMQYSGTAYSTAKCSNAEKTRECLRKQGYSIMGEEAGPRAGKRKTEGHVVFLAVRK